MERISGLDVKLTLVPFTKGLRNIFYLYSFTNFLKNYIRKNHIDIVHTHHRFPEYIVNRIKKECGIFTITTAHSLTRKYKAMSFHSDVILAVSQTVKNHLMERYNISENRILQIYNPVADLEPACSREVARKKLGIQGNRKVILFIGTISREKGFDVLIDAFRQANAKISHCMLLVAGKWKGSNRYAFTSNADILALPSQAEVSPLYAAADLVVLPSRADSFPFTMLEAGVFQKPFIGSAVGGIKEFIEHNKDGLLIEPESVTELVKSMTHLLESPEFAARLAENLRVKVKNLNSAEEYCNNLIEIYESVTND